MIIVEYVNLIDSYINRILNKYLYLISRLADQYIQIILPAIFVSWM